MGKEIERKFLVTFDCYKQMAFKELHIVQGYLNTNPDSTVRVRISGDRAWITVKGRNHGAVRSEWEFSIDPKSAREMIEECAGKYTLEKTRYYIDFKGYIWEVDRYEGENEGLVVAEVELPSADCSPELPPFVGEEVTGNPEFYNSSIARGKKISDL